MEACCGLAPGVQLSYEWCMIRELTRDARGRSCGGDEAGTSRNPSAERV